MRFNKEIIKKNKEISSQFCVHNLIFASMDLPTAIGHFNCWAINQSVSQSHWIHKRSVMFLTILSNLIEICIYLSSDSDFPEIKHIIRRSRNVYKNINFLIL